MRSSLQAGRLFGVPVRIHWSMLLLLAFVTWGGGVGGMLAGALSLALVLASVLAHEFSHVLTARRFGIDTHDVILTPLGGMARIAREPSSGTQEAVIAFAGPAMSLLLAGLSAVLVHPVGEWTFLGGVLRSLASANLVLGLFNLLPAFPLDGGRILRGVAARWMGHARATRLAVRLGVFIAAGLGLLGIAFGNFSLVMLAGFIWLAGRNESTNSQDPSVHHGEVVSMDPRNPGFDRAGIPMMRAYTVRVHRVGYTVHRNRSW